MKQIFKSEKINYPKGVTITVESRKVTVTGPRGTLEKTFKHQSVDIKVLPSRREVKVELWFGNKKQLACVKTIKSHIQNLVDGVTKGYRYKMRFVYAHFPINSVISENDTVIALRNFLGEKNDRTVNMLPGVTVQRDPKVKDQILLEGNDLENVSQSAASIHMSTLVRKKDIRKFLDGIYVSETEFIDGEEF
eukprot:TRINITY_DN1766_c0_g1_i1.p1 TRINITY_DN1766_c0_g1~~TRINITY_DN1766_c0_g1_i1.p1  ORF type:complete len:192 (-),score=61.11 TRINITY_DN1766_c0_g1_i1:56-631(-)